MLQGIETDDQVASLSLVETIVEARQKQTYWEVETLFGHGCGDDCVGEN